MARLHVVLALALVAAQASYAQDQQPPRFQSGVEVVTVDVTVVDDDGRPIRDLRPRDFVVEVDGRRRRVISAEWVALTPATPAAARVQDAARVPAAPEPYSSNETPVPGRFIMLLVDRTNIRFEGMNAHRAAIEGFIDGLQPSDRLSVVASGLGSAPSVPFTTDHERVKRALPPIVGQRGLDGPSPLRALRELLTSLKPIEAPKTIVLISEGFPIPTPDSGEPLLPEIERLAAEARTIVYSLRLDPRITDMRRTTQDTNLGPDLTAPAAAQRRGAARGQGLPAAGGPQTMPGPANEPVPDRLAGDGLYSYAAVTGGSMFTVVMKADPAFARIDSELSGYYLLGVEADPSTRDGKPHGIKVDVDRRGVTVRSRRQLIANRPPPPPRTPEEALLPAFSSPSPIAALPIRVATFSMRGAGEKNIQLMIQAEVGADYTAQKIVVLGFVIADKNDRVVTRRAGNSSLRPLVPGKGSPLQFTTSVTLEPGDYTMKLAVADGDRVGSVEHPVHAALDTAGAFAFSDLVVGGTGSGRPAMPPPVGPTIRTDHVQGVVEAYGAAAADVRGRLEIAKAVDGPAIVSAPIAAAASGSGRAVLTQVLPIQDLAPGLYMLRAVLGAPNTPPHTIVRAFERQ
jgi:VWFA-related protein